MSLDEFFTFILDIPSIIVGIFTKGMHTVLAGIMPLITMALILAVVLKFLSPPKKEKPSLAEEDGTNT